ncbi:cytochrome C oxidase subunit IV family protein [Flavobacterium tibetense]|uniref:Cytochrome C oxidase subunit IV n=1 Tax=Flavobacterium tibetense TaxID=2233533 RepID=A0A365NZP8_9FLAO|nr:cytochrome C oxidase subunit IV family protein [Flavobacterium tibetense]RBA27735.1 cytochrome C oxidase subunit IV [Flavobacterium tibetense]
MAHAHESNTKRIWYVFGLLSVITIVEVAFGIFKPESLHLTSFLGTSPLNWIFIILTIVKAYYIMWAFMHLEGEKSSFRWSIVGPLVFLILYLCFIVLIEGNYVYEVFNTGHMKWIF